MNLILHTMTSKNCVLRIKIFAHILLHLFTKLLCKTSSLSQKPFKYHIFFSFSLLLFSGRPIFEQYFTIRGQWQRHNFWRKVRMFWASRPGWWARLCSGQSSSWFYPSIYRYRYLNIIRPYYKQARFDQVIYT